MQNLAHTLSFLALFALVAGAERRWPRRTLSLPRRLRWTGNLGLAAIDIVLLRLLSPVTAVAFAQLAQQRGWGLLNQVEIPLLVSLAAALLALDLALYLQHVMFHAVPALWRLHRVHHADPELDVSVAVRFHPMEVLLSLGFRLATIALLGPPAVAVLTFELMLATTTLVRHGNVRLPPGLERALRLFLVTPDMHRVHHSMLAFEANSNFGVSFPWWDRLLGTYRAQPAAGHESMTLGLEGFRRPQDLRLDRLLIQPWQGPPDGYPLNRGLLGSRRMR